MRARALTVVALLTLTACKKHPPESAAVEGAGEAEHEPEAPPTHVHCEPAARATLADARTLRGTVTAAPDRSAVVSPQVAGRLTRVLVREGDTVRAGAALAEVEAQPAAAALTQARAQLVQAQAAAQNASLTLTRAQHLFERGIAARQEVDDATARRAEADAVVAAARAAVDVAARTLARATVRAPVDGQVLRVTRRAGELVDGTPATPVMEIADPASAELLASAAPADLVELRAGQTAEVRFDALPGRVFTATVRTVSPGIDPATGVGSVRLVLAAGEGARPPFGLFGVATVRVGERANAVVVPAAALRGGGAGSEVVVCEAGHARVRAVQVGAREAGRAEVASGLREGERVAVENVLGLADGAAIEEEAAR